MHDTFSRYYYWLNCSLNFIFLFFCVLLTNDIYSRFRMADDTAKERRWMICMHVCSISILFFQIFFTRHLKLSFKFWTKTGSKPIIHFFLFKKINENMTHVPPTTKLLFHIIICTWQEIAYSWTSHVSLFTIRRKKQKSWDSSKVGIRWATVFY